MFGLPTCEMFCRVKATVPSDVGTDTPTNLMTLSKRTYGMSLRYAQSRCDPDWLRVIEDCIRRWDAVLG
jgi:hypothetical protein